MKIGIVGAGFVGASAAYALVMRGVGREIVLVDKNQKRAIAEAEDLFHAVPFANPLLVRHGDYPDLADSNAVIMAAGVNQKPGETRLQLLARNAAVFREVIPQILANAPDAVLIVATNPVDVMTHLSAALANERGVPVGRVFGSGTTLDTARFRALLSQRLHVDPAHIHAHVLGEHGDSEVLAWSNVTIGGLPLEEYTDQAHIDFTETDRAEIDLGVRRAAYHIIEGKGATYYGIGSALAQIVDVVLHNQRAIMTVCAPQDDVFGVQNVTVALPNLLSGSGVQQTLPVHLTTEEAEKLRNSAAIVKAAIGELDVKG
jgi:L-lactate dehydrogenase